MIHSIASIHFAYINMGAVGDCIIIWAWETMYNIDSAIPIYLFRTYHYRELPLLQCHVLLCALIELRK